MSVWDGLTGQQPVVAELSRVAGEAAPDRDAAAAGARTGMTHAWLFTGPPGSGRSVAARAFAAALECPDQGCGDCDACRTVMHGTHPDVVLIQPSLVSFGVDATRDLVRRASLAPATGRWQVIIVEDADRLTEQAVNALLKAVEEPAPHTVWLLCAPTTEDLLPTLRSRCRHVRLRTPPSADIAAVLVRDGVAEDLAASAARASQGHIGRARWLATDESARDRRLEVIAIPARLGGLDACLDAAATLVGSADADAKAATATVDEEETDGLRRALGVGTQGRAPRGVEAAMRDLESRQKKRSKRQQRDSLDRALLELLGFYRDVLALQLGAVGASFELAGVPPDDPESSAVRGSAAASTPESTLRRMEAILACREALDGNASPPLAVEAMVLALRAG